MVAVAIPTTATANNYSDAGAAVSRHETDTETDNGSPPGMPAVIRNAYVTLAGFALTVKRSDVTCSICGLTTRMKHCVTCHEPNGTYTFRGVEHHDSPPSHGSCFGCGACMPPKDERRYCSSTCRVRAHNYYHHTEEGQARAAAEKAAADAWMKAFSTAFGDKAPDQVVEARRRALDAYHRGQTCGDCGQQLPPDAPVYRSRRQNFLTIVGTCCVIEGGKYHVLAGPCEQCGRPVYRQRGERAGVSGGYGYGRPYRVLCSAACRYRLQGEVRRELRRPEPRPCAVCHETFEPTRSDSIYCSSACRQRAYRARRAT